MLGSTNPKEGSLSEGIVETEAPSGGGDEVRLGKVPRLRGSTFDCGGIRVSKLGHPAAALIKVHT